MIEEFFEYMLSRGKSEKTAENYKADVEAFTRWYSDTCGEDLSPGKVSGSDLREYKQYLLINRNCAPATVNRRLAALRSYFKFAGEKGFDIPPVPKEVRTGHKNTAPKSLTGRQEDALCRAVYRYGSTRDRAVIELILNTGLRVSEACGLLRRDLEIKPRGGSVTVNGKGEQFRVIPLNNRARQALTVYLEEYPSESHEKLFRASRGPQKNSISPRGMQRIVEKYKNLAGIEDTVTVHTLRHTFASRLLERGRSLVEVQALLGHENINTTSLYTKPRIQSLQSAVNMLD